MKNILDSNSIVTPEKVDLEVMAMKERIILQKWRLTSR